MAIAKIESQIFMKRIRSANIVNAVSLNPKDIPPTCTMLYYLHQTYSSVPRLRLQVALNRSGNCISRDIL